MMNRLLISTPKREYFPSSIIPSDEQKNKLYKYRRKKAEGNLNRSLKKDLRPNKNNK